MTKAKRKKEIIFQNLNNQEWKRNSRLDDGRMFVEEHLPDTLTSAANITIQHDGRKESIIDAQQQLHAVVQWFTLLHISCYFTSSTYWTRSKHCSSLFFSLSFFLCILLKLSFSHMQFSNIKVNWKRNYKNVCTNLSTSFIWN